MKTGYLRVTHPCATLLTAEAAFAFDLHVLSTPPAFVLSQDQTLQLYNPSKITRAANLSIGHPNLARSSYPVLKDQFRPRHQTSAPASSDRPIYHFTQTRSTCFLQSLPTFLGMTKNTIKFARWNGNRHLQWANLSRCKPDRRAFEATR